MHPTSPILKNQTRKNGTKSKYHSRRIQTRDLLPQTIVIRCDVRPLPPWAFPSSLRCRSRKPNVPASAPCCCAPDCSPALRSILLHPLQYRSPAPSPPFHPTTPADVSASAIPPVHCPGACTSTSLQDMLGPAGHTLHPPSALPSTPLPSPLHAPHKFLHVSPAPLLVSADSARADWLAGSVRRNSPPALQIPPPSPPAHASPAPQTARVYTSHSYTPPPYRSTHRELVAAPFPAIPPVCSALPSALPPAPGSAIPEPGSCIRTPASHQPKDRK